MEQKEKGKKKKIVKNKKEEEKITEIFSGTVSSNSQLKSNNIDQLAQYLWVNFDRTRLNDNWNDEIPQRQIKWTTHAEHILTEILNKK